MILLKDPLDAALRHAQVRLARSIRLQAKDDVDFTEAPPQAPKRPQAEPLSQPQTPNTGATRTGVRGGLRSGLIAVRSSA